MKCYTYLYVTVDVPQSENIQDVLACEVDHFPSVAYIVVKLLHPLNILRIAVAFLVSKLHKSRVDKVEQPSNIYPIFVTLLVSKLLTSKLVKADKTLNIPSIFVTLLVSK